MRRRIGLFLIISLVGVQSLSLLHALEHGAVTHDHDGLVCDICLHVEQVQFSNIGPMAGSTLVGTACLFRVAYLEPLNTFQSLAGVAYPRAPPTFS